jgi:hypothetical protein
MDVIGGDGMQEVTIEEIGWPARVRLVASVHTDEELAASIVQVEWSAH